VTPGRVVTAPTVRLPRPSLPLDSVLLCGRHLRLMGRRPASLAEVIVLPLAFTLLFFTVFQRTMARVGIDYAQYLIPAVIVQAVFFTALSTAVHAAEDAQSGLLRRLRCLPVARAAPSAGLLLAEFVSVVISMAVLIPVGMVLGFRFEAGFLAATGFVGVACLFALTLCAGYLALGLTASRPEGANAFAVLIYFPLLLLSNAFTTTEAFPDWLEPVVQNQPVTRVIDALRALSTDGADLARPVLVAVVWLIPLLGLFGLFATRSFGRMR
jgi:ABC transporter DrrB family efflux protein